MTKTHLAFHTEYRTTHYNECKNELINTVGQKGGREENHRKHNLILPIV